MFITILLHCRMSTFTCNTWVCAADSTWLGYWMKDQRAINRRWAGVWLLRGSPRRHGDGGLCVGHRIKAAGGDGGSAADLVQLPTTNRSLLSLLSSDLLASGVIKSKISFEIWCERDYFRGDWSVSVTVKVRSLFLTLERLQCNTGLDGTFCHKNLD